MHPTARSLAAVFISGFIVQILASSVPWWSFLVILCIVYLVAEAAIQAICEQHDWSGGRKRQN